MGYNMSIYKIISSAVMVVGGSLMLTSTLGLTSVSLLTGVIVFSSGSIGLLLSPNTPVDKNS